MAQKFFPIHFQISNQCPTHIGEDLYLCGSFNNWSQEHIYLGKIPAVGETLSADLEALKAGEWELKLSRGDWHNLFASPAGKLADPVILNHSKASELALTIEAWRDDFPASTASKEVHILDEHFFFPNLDVYRKVLIYLPASYAQHQQRYPVLYMHDGQHVFDEATSVGRSGPIEWQVDETINQATEQAIVVAIYHARTFRLREQEYMVHNSEEIQDAKGFLYLEDIVEVLKPFIDKQYRTLPDSQHTAMLGSSLGGLISLYAGIKYPEVFGWIGAFSPSIWMDEEKLYEFSSNSLNEHADRYVQQQLYFYIGSREIRNNRDHKQSNMLIDLEHYNDWLTDQYPGTISFSWNEQGKHGAFYWQKAFVDFFKYWQEQLTLIHNTHDLH